MSKPRIIKDYDSLSDEVKEQVKLIYPRGFRRHLVSFVNKEGQRKMGLPFETEDYYYLIRMTEEGAVSIIREDDDYGEDGRLKEKARNEYEDKYDDVDYLSINANDDNDFDADTLVGDLGEYGTDEGEEEDDD